MSGTGNLLGSEITVSSGAAEQTYPALAANGAGGGWAVAWQEGATNADIRASHVDGTGDLLGEEEDISEAANSQERPALTYDSARGRYLAVWESYRHAGSGPLTLRRGSAASCLSSAYRMESSQDREPALSSLG